MEDTNSARFNVEGRAEMIQSSPEVLTRQIDRLAKYPGVEVMARIGYRDVTLIVADGRSFHAHVREHRLNVLVNSEPWCVIDAICERNVKGLPAELRV